MAGLAVNAAVRDKPAKEKLEFFGNSFFIPIFFIVTGFLIDPIVFFQSITANFPLASAVIDALLVGRWITAQTVGCAFAYSPVARLTMVVTHVAAGGGDTRRTLVAFDTRNLADPRAVAYHFHSWTGSHRALRASPPQRRNNATGSHEGRGNTLIPQECMATMRQLLS